MNIDETCEYVRKNCQRILKTYKITSKVLEHGNNDIEQDFTIFDMHNYQRQPKGATLFGSEFFDHCMRANGITTNRLNSFYASTDFNLARQFGSPYKVFPTDDFDYFWNSTSQDSWELVDSIKHSFDTIDFLHDLPNIFLDYLVESFKKQVEHWQIKNFREELVKLQYRFSHLNDPNINAIDDTLKASGLPYQITDRLSAMTWYWMMRPQELMNLYSKYPLRAKNILLQCINLDGEGFPQHIKNNKLITLSKALFNDTTFKTILKNQNKRGTELYKSVGEDLIQDNKLMFNKGLELALEKKAEVLINNCNIVLILVTRDTLKAYNKLMSAEQ